MKTKRLYALITTNCNLHCPHCEIRTRPDGYNREKFLEELNSFEGTVNLFGGEPSLYEDRLFDIVENNTAKNIHTISTNLVILNDRLIEFYKTLRGIASSWNPNRFSEEQYQSWLNNLNTFEKNKLKTAVLVTLTNDLFELGVDKFIEVTKAWNPNAIHYIRFEHYIGDGTTKEYYDKADDFLCEFYKKWDFSIPLQNAKALDYGYCYECGEIYNLSPNGVLSRGCPHGYNAKVPTECYSCEMVANCKPCRLQPLCSYPHKFAKLVKESKDDS